MEGVVVSAKKDGSTMSISVVTDGKGRYTFPAAKLEPGHYALKIRAIGYDLDGANAADVKAGATATADVELSPTKNLAEQLTNLMPDPSLATLAKLCAKSSGRTTPWRRS